MSDVPIPKGVFWVYPTNRFHRIDTRADMGDEFAAHWLPRRKEFPMSTAADSHPDGIGPPMVQSAEQLAGDIASLTIAKAQGRGKTLRDLIDDVDRPGKKGRQEP